MVSAKMIKLFHNSKLSTSQKSSIYTRKTPGESEENTMSRGGYEK
jgi:hypothetical protein